MLAIELISFLSLLQQNYCPEISYWFPWFTIIGFIMVFVVLMNRRSRFTSCCQYFLQLTYPFKGYKNVDYHEK